MATDKDYIKNIEGAERRFVTEPVTIQQRADEDTEAPAVIEGYAFKFNKVTTIGSWFKEEILPGAADGLLIDDIRCLFNHDPNLILARSENGKGTLTLEIDSIGLKYSYTTPDRTYAKDLEDAIKSGDVSQSSFSFKADEVIWKDGADGELDLRQIKKFKKLYDVSPVTYPAYVDTTVGKRTFENHISDIEVKEAQIIEKNKRAFNTFSARHKFNKNKY